MTPQQIEDRLYKHIDKDYIKFANACKVFGVKVKAKVTDLDYAHFDRLLTKIKKHRDPKFCLDLMKELCK